MQPASSTRPHPPLVAILVALAISAAPVAAAFAPLEPAVLPDVDDVYPLIPRWSGTRVLHIGDSHVSAGLKRGLAQRLRAAGARYRAECWVGSRAKSWVASGKLRRLLVSYAPRVVIVTLGTNALDHPSPERYGVWVRGLVERIGARMCYWIGPPPVLDDAHGFGDMLETNSRPCRYFDSTVLDVAERKDGHFHLSRDEGERWASLTWRWMNGAPIDGGIDAL